MNHNTVSLIGNLCRDAELKYTHGGMAILSLSLAVNRSVKKGEGWEQVASFFDVTAFGKLAEWRAELKKGSGVLVAGELRQEAWEKDGQKRSKVVIIADTIEEIKRGESKHKEEARPPANDGFADEIPF